MIERLRRWLREASLRIAEGCANCRNPACAAFCHPMPDGLCQSCHLTEARAWLDAEGAVILGARA